MKIEKLSRSIFKQCENSTSKKLLLNICDYLNYGLTDSNDFYKNLYVEPQKDYYENNHNLGDVFYSTPLSYHIIANMVCVQLPKTTYNIIPFKMKWFKRCCNSVIEYINNNEIKEIHTPIFGTKILEGKWIDILSIMKETFSKSDHLNKLCIYE